MDGLSRGVAARTHPHVLPGSVVHLLCGAVRRAYGTTAVTTDVQAVTRDTRGAPAPPSPAAARSAYQMKQNARLTGVELLIEDSAPKQLASQCESTHKKPNRIHIGGCAVDST